MSNLIFRTVIHRSKFKIHLRCLNVLEFCTKTCYMWLNYDGYHCSAPTLFSETFL